MNAGQIKLESSFPSLKKYSLPADFKYVLIDRVMTRDYKLSNLENFTLNSSWLIEVVLHLRYKGSAARSYKYN